MFVIYTKNIRFFYKEAKIKPPETLYINAKHAIVSYEGFVRLFDERGEQIFAGCLEFIKCKNDDVAYDVRHLTLQEAVRIALKTDDFAVYFNDISAEEV